MNHAQKPGQGNSITPETIRNRMTHQFLEFLTAIQAEVNPANAIHACKQLLRVRADLDYSHYETLLIRLCKLLISEQRYGETLYYYLAAPYYLDSMMNAGNLLTRGSLKDEAFKRVVLALNTNRRKVNVLLYDSNLNGVQNLKDTITIACNQNCYVSTDYYDLLNQESSFINHYQLIIIVNNYNSQTMAFMDKFKQQFGKEFLMTLHCHTLADAKRFYYEYGGKIEYITYNDKMLYGVIHTALRLTGHK